MSDDPELSCRLLALGERCLTAESDALLLLVWRMTYRDGLTSREIAERLEASSDPFRFVYPEQVRYYRRKARRRIIARQGTEPVRLRDRERAVVTFKQHGEVETQENTPLQRALDRVREQMTE